MALLLPTSDGPNVRSTLLRHIEKHPDFQVFYLKHCLDATDWEEVVNGHLHLGRTTIRSLAKLSQHDASTYWHSFRVSGYMVKFARALSLDTQSVREFAIGGLLHDLGKLAVPVEILQKEGQLNETEMDCIREHSRRGYELVRVQGKIAQQVLDICLFHHEKYDGSGYPAKLQGIEIPFSARVASICDVYDALTTVRSYKSAWSNEKAVKIMTDSVGHFDPVLLDVFLRKVICYI